RAAVAKLVSRGKEQIIMIRPYRGGLVLPTLGKGLLSECPATSLNRKNTAASTACESWRWSMQKSKAAKSSPRSSPASRRRSSTSWIEAEHEEGPREKSCQRSQGAEDSVKGLTAPANKRLGMDPNTALNIFDGCSRSLSQRGYAHRRSLCGLGCARFKRNRSMAV